MLHPQARQALDDSAGQVPVTDPTYDIPAAREAARILAASQPREDVAEVLDIDADGVPVRLYRPAGARSGVVLHLHGGGFVFNDVDVHDAAVRTFANLAGVTVLSVDYRRPPEHRFPAAPDDVDTVVGWLDREGEAYGVSGPTYAHGDSAGGNLALVAALRNPGRFAALALIYPFLDPVGDHESYRSQSEGFDPSEAAWYWDQYVTDPAALDNPDVAPLRSEHLGTLPPTLVVTAEHDPLRDEGELLYARLAALGVQVYGTRVLGQIHGFWRHTETFDAALPLMGQVAAFLRQHA